MGSSRLCRSLRGSSCVLRLRLRWLSIFQFSFRRFSFLSPSPSKPLLPINKTESMQKLRKKLLPSEAPLTAEQKTAYSQAMEPTKYRRNGRPETAVEVKFLVSNRDEHRRCVATGTSRSTPHQTSSHRSRSHLASSVHAGKKTVELSLALKLMLCL